MGDRIHTGLWDGGPWRVGSKIAGCAGSHFSLQTHERVFFLWKRKRRRQLQMLRGTCERALCFRAIPTPLPMPGFRSETCSRFSSFSLSACFFTRKPLQVLLAGGRVTGLPVSAEGQWQSRGAGAWFGNRGWDPSRAVQAAELPGQASSVRSSPLRKSLIGTPKTPKCWLLKILFVTNIIWFLIFIV